MVKQVIRSSGSVGANYIEANESLGKKDFAMRIRICRKEAKETVYWLKLVETNDNSLDIKRALYIQEGTEIMKIFGAILIKSE
jgi:four helix bundle protein